MKVAATVRPEAPVKVSPDLTHKLGPLVDQAAAAWQLDRTLVDKRRPNVWAMVRRVASAHPEATLAMLQQTFPDVQDLGQIKRLAQLHVQNEGRPLRLLPLPSSVDPEKISPNLSERVFGDQVVLTDEEAIVVQDDRAWGPMPRDRAIREAARAGAASPTHDAEGHILDPEEALPAPAMVAAPTLEIT